MSLFRPTCVSLVRRFCSSQLQIGHTRKSPILVLLSSHRLPRQYCRPFRPSQCLFAKVIDAPQDATGTPQRKRTVRIGQLPDGPVYHGTIQQIFGHKLSHSEGNSVLRILHHRRTAGSLADHGVDNLGKQFKHVTHDVAMKGLEWLREKYPIDEARAAEEWAEKEANRISYELWLADPETESKYKDPARVFREELAKEEQERQQYELENRKIGILHVGKSQFERNIEEKRRERLEEVTRKAEEKERKEREMEEKLATGEWVKTPTGMQLMKPGQTTYMDVFGREQVSRRKEEAERYQKASQVTPAETPEELLEMTTLTQRLYPMTAFVFLVVIASYGFAHFYLPPAPSYRLLPDISSATATIAVILGANVAVSIAWRIMPLWPLMTRFFMHVPAYPRAVQAVGNVFSHVQYEHLLANMMVFCLVGPACYNLVDRGVFLGTYISAGAVGTLVSLYWANLGRGNITAHSVGASAAIWGISALYCLLTDQDVIKIPFLKDTEVAFWPKMLFASLVMFEIYAAVRKRKRATADHASHFGGMLVGVSTAAYMRATGWYERKANERPQDGVQAEAQVDPSTVDVGATAVQQVKEVKQSVTNALEK